MKQPTISIITITFNAEKYLRDTIESVLGQTYLNIEYIIVDGQSTDQTVNIISSYEDRLAHWISEPDRGIADAMNKGWRLSTGDFVFFLNADDYIINKHEIAQLIPLLDEYHDIFAFPLLFESNNIQRVRKPRRWAWWINFKVTLDQPSCLFKHNLIDRVGELDFQFTCAFDHDFSLRAYRQRCKVKYLEPTFVLMRDGGVSNQRDWPSLKKRFLEERAVHYKNCDSTLKKYVYHVYWLLYLPYRKLRYWLS